jgi:hypothetical protein
VWDKLYKKTNRMCLHKARGTVRRWLVAIGGGGVGGGGSTLDAMVLAWSCPCGREID